MPSLGEDLRTLRLQQHLPLETVSQRTRISKRYLEYIEEDRFDMLPGGVFNRAFLRTYAELLGMNPQEAVTRYSKHFSGSKEKPSRGEPLFYRHRPLLRFVASTGLTLLLLGLGVVFLYREIVSARLQVEQAREAAAAMPDLSLLSSTTTLPATGAGPEAPEAESPVAEPGVEYPLTLQIEAINQCWISVSADGRQITSQLLARGDKLPPFHANNQFSLILGNAAGVNLRVNGASLRRVGGSGEVKRLILRLDNYKEFLAEPAGPSSRP